MSGLKSGSGDDLWDDEGEDDPESDGEQQSQDPQSETDTTGGGSSDRSTTGGEQRSSGTESTGSDERSYIVRRAIQNKSVQFERDERLTFFVHDDVVDGERELLGRLESELGRDVPKFDVREAVYRAALANPDDVLRELLEMGYTRDE